VKEVVGGLGKLQKNLLMIQVPEKFFMVSWNPWND
jgi:hypothetical protein